MQFRHGNWHEWFKRKHRILRAPAFWTILSSVNLDGQMAHMISRGKGTTLLGHFDIDPYSGVHFDSTQYPSNSVARMVQLGLFLSSSTIRFWDTKWYTPIPASSRFIIYGFKDLLLFITTIRFSVNLSRAPITSTYWSLGVKSWYWLTERVATICQSGLYDLVCITDQF